jgi:sec-independent protein translocase protein TatC
MIDKDQPSLPGDPEQPSFEDALSFHAWNGECASCEDPPEADPPAERNKEENTAPEDAGDSEGKPMSLMGHLKELRSRLVRILIMVMLGFFACYAVADVLFGELVKPLTASMPQGSKLIFTAPAEAFFVYMKVGFMASRVLTSPYIFDQIWAFVAHGLYDAERRHIVPLAIVSAFFFLSGAAFCYFMVFPIIFDFFMSFATDTILPMPSLDAYLGFALKLLIAFGLIFEMPLFAFFLARIGVLTAAHLRRWRKYAVLASVIVGALLTPPDVFSQLIMAAAILVLYEASIWIMAMTQKRPQKADKNAQADTPAQETP